MSPDYATEILSRVQFAFTMGFHIVFPTLNIGLGLFLAIMEGLWLKTGLRVYYKICRFWGKIFGTKEDYYVAEGVADSVPFNGGREDTPADMEARGTGVNEYVYWVCNCPASNEWKVLPDLTP